MAQKETLKRLVAEITVRSGTKPTLGRFGGIRRIRRIVTTLGDLLELSNTEVSVLLTGDDEIRELNRTYRHKDKATDVLSFPSAENPGDDTEFLGDIAVSVPVCLRQAKEYGVTDEEELRRLLTHALLHLLGYDHENVPRAEAQRMRRKETALLRELEAALPLDGQRK